MTSEKTHVSVRPICSKSLQYGLLCYHYHANFKISNSQGRQLSAKRMLQVADSNEAILLDVAMRDS